MKSTKKQYEMDMCSGSILKKMLLFALPLMLSSILQLLFNAADIVVVGKFAGDNALAAVGSNTALINLLTNLFVGFSIGANVTAARYYGAKCNKDLEETIHTAVTMSFASGLLLMVVGVIFAEQFLIWMQTPKEVLPLATLYLHIYFIGMIPNMVYNFGSALLRAVGDTRRPLYYLTFAGCINVILNIFTVIVLHWDVAGVAIATVISETISAFLVLRCMQKERGVMHLQWNKLRIHRGKMIQIMKIGIPAGFQGVVFALSNVVIQSSVNLFGNVVVAGNSAASNIEGFVYMAMNAFYQATISFTSQNFGAGKYNRINRILLTGQGCVIVVGLVLGNAAVLFGQPLLQIYSSSPEVIAAGMVRLHIISATYALCGIMDVMVGALRGLNYSVLPMVVSLIGACGLRLIWIATIFQIPEFHTVQVVYLSYPLTWIITLSAHIVCYCLIKKHLRKQISCRKASLQPSA